MAIVQISKIQQRSGNIVDLPQLDEAEFGWATDAKQLFIGKTSPNENIEVLTSYSNISFSQITGSSGNLNIDGANVANGEVLAFDGSNWVNKGGNAGGLLTFGSISNVKITGGGIGYVIETDGTGNLSWTPKATIVAYVQNATQANPGVLTTTADNFFVDGSLITITGVPGMTQLNGNTYYANVLTANTFSLYSDSSLTTPVDTSGFGAFPYTSVTATSSATDRITVGSSAAFTVNDPIIFIGTTFGGIIANTTYYVNATPTGTTIKISDTLGGNALALTTASGTCNVYTTGGRIISSVSGSGSTAAAGGSNTTVQFNNGGVLDGSANLTWNGSVLSVTGNANVGNNVNVSNTVTAKNFVSNVANGTAPLTVTSVTRVSNLSVAYSNVSDFGVVTTQTTGTFYPVFVNANTTGNLALASNANLSFNAATGALAATLLTGTLTTAAQPNITSLGTLSALGVNGTITGVNITANTGVFTGNGSGLSALNASNVTTGTLAQARLANSTFTLGSTVVTLGGSNATIAGLTSVTSTTFTGTLTTNAQPNITSVGTLTSLAVTGDVTAGNMYANSGTLGATTINASGDVTANTLISTVATGTAPLTVTSTTQVSNLYVDRANTVSVATDTAGTWYPISVSGITGTTKERPTRFTGYSYVSSTGVLTVGNISTATVTATALTTGANTTAGTITGNWSLSTGSRLNATYADLAEYYRADAGYEPGTVVEFGGDYEITIASMGTRRVAGIISTEPALAMNTACPGEFALPLALQGRVPCKVLGPILKGDMLISAGAGYAKASSSDPLLGTVIGKALENFEGVTGVIEVVVGRL